MSDVEWREQVDKLLAFQDQAVRTFQWVTNNVQMTPTQHIKLGDALCLLHDASEQMREWMNKGE